MTALSISTPMWLLAGVLALAACAPTVTTTAPPAQAPVAPEGAVPPTDVPQASGAIDDGRIRAAVLLPLSGPNATIGNALLDAAQLAVFDLADERFMLMPYDTQGTPSGATTAANDALADGADIVIGPLFAGSVRAAKPLLRNAGVSALALTNDRNLAGDGTYIMGFLPSAQVERVVGYARSQGLSRYAALAPVSPYGDTVVDALYAAAFRFGGQVTQVQRYDPSAPDVTPVVRALAAGAPGGDLGFDAVMLPEGGDRLRAIAPVLPFFDIDPDRVRFLGTGLWDEPGLGREPALVGSWFAAPSPDDRADFEARYEEAFGTRPPRLATLAYDATALAAVLAQRRENPDYDVTALTAPSGFAGLDGLFRLRPDGLVDRGLAVIEITANGYRVIDPAPTSFELLTN